MLMRYYIQVGQRTGLMEKSRSWPSAHDWKSCIPQKGIEGSNPSFSAKRNDNFQTKVVVSFVLLSFHYALFTFL